MPRAPPQPRIYTKDLLPVPPAANVKLALGTLLALQILYRGVILKHQLQVKLYEVVKGDNQQCRQAPRNAYYDSEDTIYRMQSGLIRCELDEHQDEGYYARRYNDRQGSKDIEQQLYEKLPVVEADTIVDPWAMVIHIKDAAVANTAVVCAVRLPHIAHLAVPPALCLIAHVKAPIRWYKTRIRHDALVDRDKQVEE